MTKPNEVVVGQLRKGGELKDAIHVAIAPVVAGAALQPGDHVAILPGSPDVVVSSNDPNLRVGIIDPYLVRPIRRGELVWLFLYVGTTLGIRHDWQHPAFTDGDAEIASNPEGQSSSRYDDDYYDDDSGCPRGCY